jgi:EAL domain-containing protein (putative c-di-GMP-specific phosphodiesterase class I)/GGDEF domain-containing protein
LRTKRTGRVERSPAIRRALAELLEREAFTIVYQPIVALQDGRIVGYEALTRPAADSGFASADALYSAAEACGMLIEVEAAARRHAFAAVGAVPDGSLLFVNNSPPVFMSEPFHAVVSEEAVAAGLRPDRIVLEITERNEPRRMDDLGVRVLLLREMGFTVALDDVGAGTSGLNQIMTLRPNWLKVDRELVTNIDFDPLKQNLMRFFVQFARLGNMSLVAEGIERTEELAVLMRIGVTHGQGWALARPGEFGAELTGSVRAHLLELRRGIELRSTAACTAIRAGAIAEPVVACDVADTIATVLTRLQSMAQQRGVVVLDRCRYLGWLGRESLLLQRRQHGDREQIGALVVEPSPVVGHDFTLSEAMEIVAGRPEAHQTLPLLVQRDGVIVGLVTLRDLLMTAAEAHRRAPSHVAPLTGLPSRVQADRWIASRIKAGDSCDIAYIDLRDFDAYNLAYGFERGDEMLMQLVQLIRTHVVDVERGATFFAHLGEDRFMLAFPRDARGDLVALIDAFEEAWSTMFAASDMAAETFRCDDPFGQSRTYPLTTLRIVYLARGLEAVSEPRELHDHANRLRLRSRTADPGRTRELITERRQPRAARRRSA